LEFICADYTKTLHTLLRFELSAKKKIMIYTGLAVIATKRLDLNKLESCLASLNAFPQEELQTFAINPLNCLETVYYYLKYGIINKEAFTELTHFYFNPPVNDDSLKNNNANDVLCLLAVYTLSVCNSPVKTLRFINALDKVYTHEQVNSQSFNFMLQLAGAEAHFALGKTCEGNKIYEEITVSYEKDKDSFTPFMKASYYLLKVKTGLYNRDKAAMQQALKSLIYLADNTGLKLIKVQAFVFILLNKCKLDLDDSYINQAYYEFTRIIRGIGFREESFVDNCVIMAIR
jgi:hypothetical protein